MTKRFISYCDTDSDLRCPSCGQIVQRATMFKYDIAAMLYDRPETRRCRLCGVEFKIQKQTKIVAIAEVPE